MYHKIQGLRKRGGDHKFEMGTWSSPVFGYLSSNTWEWTKKVDGMNMRIVCDPSADPVFRYAGKSDNAQIPGRLAKHMDALIARPDVRAALLSFGEPLTVYGEGYGAGIQRGGMYGNEQRFIAFDIHKRFLPQNEMREFLTELGIPVSPVRLTCDIHTAEEIVRRGMTSSIGEGIAEGLVGRPLVEMCDVYGNRVITKVKHRDY